MVPPGRHLAGLRPGKHHNLLGLLPLLRAGRWRRRGRRLWPRRWGWRLLLLGLLVLFSCFLFIFSSSLALRRSSSDELDELDEELELDEEDGGPGPRASPCLGLAMLWNEVPPTPAPGIEAEPPAKVRPGAVNSEAPASPLITGIVTIGAGAELKVNLFAWSA